MTPSHFFIFLKGNLTQISSGLEVILGYFGFTEFGVLEFFWFFQKCLFFYIGTANSSRAYIKEETFLKKSEKFKHTKLGETKITKNDFQTWRYLRQIPLQENKKMWGGHWLKNHPQNPSQNSSKRVNHPVIIGRVTVWSPRAGNETIHIPYCNWE